MATSVSDLLEVNLLLLEAGLYRPGETPEADIMAVPLFETVADLEAAPQVMADWFALPEIAAITAARGYQEVMIGYSDSNKDGRSEERRGGKEGVRTCRSRWWPYH